MNAELRGLDLIRSLSSVDLLALLCTWVSKVLLSLLKLEFLSCSAALRTMAHPIHMWVDSEVKRSELKVELNKSNQQCVSLFKVEVDLLLHFSLNSLYVPVGFFFIHHLKSLGATYVY